jgi:hypothetical protein
MSVYCGCCVLSGSGLCVGLTTLLGGAIECGVFVVIVKPRQ